MNRSAVDDREAAVLERLQAGRARRTRFTDDVVTSAHGAGGKASAALLEHVFLPAFSNDALAELGDAATVPIPDGRTIAVTTDAFVVRPLEFPGGSLGHLAVNGTVNDLAVSGATPVALTAGFILEEGLRIDVLRRIVADMAAAAAALDLPIVAGDTKVVDRRAGDGMFVCTTGIGTAPTALTLGAATVRPGDVVIVSGTLGDHGIAVLLARGDLDFDADVVSDTAPLLDATEALLDAVPGTRWMRDATRGGVATVCNELAAAAGCAVVIEERRLPVRAPVAGACELLGIDPLYVANEAKFVAVVPAGDADRAVAVLRSHAVSSDAVVIGEIAETPPGVVVLVTALGSTRIVDRLVGDPLPRIC